MKKNISEEVLESIVVDKLFFGSDTQTICEKHGLSNTFVSATVSAYKAVEAQDWDRVKFMLNGKQVTLKTIEWAAGRLGITVPDEVYAKPEPIPSPVEAVEPQLDGQIRMEEFQLLKLDRGANNTLHALIDAINRNTAALNAFVRRVAE